jgi:hypothetical protein
VRSAAPPYKLFEVVPGARLDVAAPSGERVVAEVEVATPTGRRFAYRSEAIADATGTARLRLPNATRTSAPARPVGPWRLRAGDRAPVALAVGESDVLDGVTIRIAP